MSLSVENCGGERIFFGKFGLDSHDFLEQFVGFFGAGGDGLLMNAEEVEGRARIGNFAVF